MKNKGFTLIELLAVIVILAIIALIATPVILNIIDDARKSSDEQSINMYGKAVKNAVANYMLVHPEESIPTGNYETTDGKCLKLPGETNCKLEIDYDGNKVECNTININKKGNVYLNECKVNDKKVDYIYGATTLVQHIINLYKPNSTAVNNGITYNIDTKNKIIDDGLGGTVASGGNLRYYGTNPDNYIDIGDRDSSGNPILWRMIGVFKDVQVTDEDGNVTGTEDLVKIIRNEALGYYSWDVEGDERGMCYNPGSSNWINAPIKSLITSAYYFSTSVHYCNYGNYSYSNLNFTNDGLSEKARTKVENVQWKIKGIPSSYETLYSSDIYNYETINFSAWSGKVGLMYPSDYGYASNFNFCNTTLFNYITLTECTTNNWILTDNYYKHSQYTIIGDGGSVWGTDGIANTYGWADSPSHVSTPVLYLKSNISVIGEGTTSEGINYKIVG